MIPTLVTLAVVVAAVLVYWFPVRRWYRRSGAMRLEGGRAMSGDTEILIRDADSTLAITVDAKPKAVWAALLDFGWPREGRRLYELVGRWFGYLEPQGPLGGDSGDRSLRALPLGKNSQIPVRLAEAPKTLVLGRNTGTRRWTWQFEIATLDEHRTRLILRARAQAAPGPAAAAGLWAARAVSFALTRKMLLDVKRLAELQPANGSNHRKAA